MKTTAKSEAKLFVMPAAKRVDRLVSRPKVLRTEDKLIYLLHDALTNVTGIFELIFEQSGITQKDLTEWRSQGDNERSQRKTPD